MTVIPNDHVSIAFLEPQQRLVGVTGMSVDGGYVEGVDFSVAYCVERGGNQSLPAPFEPAATCPRLSSGHGARRNAGSLETLKEVTDTKLRGTRNPYQDISAVARAAGV